MPTQPKWQDLLKTTSPLIAMATAGCAASHLLQMPGTELILGGGLTALGFGVTTAGANIISSIIASPFSDRLKERAFDPQSLLQNRHLFRLTALAIKAKLLEAAHDKDSFLPPNVARLKKMAKHIEADWQEVPETLAFNLVQTQLVKEDLQRWFLDARDNPQPTALTVEHWTIFLRAVGLKHACELDADKLTLMAERLHTQLPVAVRELLKDDFAHGGEAFAALLLRMLADIYGAVQDVKGQAGSDPNTVSQMRQLLTKLRMMGSTMTQRFDDLPTRDELLPLLTEIKQADALVLDWLNEIKNQLNRMEQAQTDEFTVLKEMLDRALTSGVRPRLQPFTPPLMFPPSASKLFGREEQGGQLLELVRRHPRVAVTGDGGLGKTALAAEVLQQLSRESNGVEWFAGGLFLHDFYQQPTFGAFVETILVHAGQSGQTPDEQIALAAEVLKRPGTFVYLEGAEKLAAELPAVLRLLDGNTRLLLTTREPRHVAGMRQVALKTIDLDEAAAAIRHYMTQTREGNDLSALPFADDDPAWHDLARDMGGHALGCKLVGQLCGELAIAPAELHTTLAEQGLTSLAPGVSSKDNLDVLFRQGALAFCASGQPEPCDALRAWQALTLAGTNPMPRSVLRELGVSQHDGLLALIRRGLVISAQLPPDNAGKTEPAYALTHALLAKWARKGLAEFGLPHDDFLRRAMAWGLTQRDTLERLQCVPGGPQRYAVLAPLAEGLLREVRRITDLTPAEKHTFFYLPALMHYLHGNFLSAEPLYRAALAEMEAVAGQDAEETAAALNNLAALLKATNRLVEAEPLMRRALAIGEKTFGLEHPKVALRLNNLAQLLQATNRLAEAEPLYRRALAINEKAYPSEHAAVGLSLSCVAYLLHATNRLAEAEPLMRRALAIDEQSYGAEHPVVAIRLNNLAQLLKDKNRLAEAEPLMRRALAISEHSYGAEHPDVAIQLNNLSQLLHYSNRLAEAEPLYRRALAISEHSYGGEHPDVAFKLNNLARLLQATNRLAEAEPLMRRAVEIFRASLGDEHPNTVTVAKNYRLLLDEMGR